VAGKGRESFEKRQRERDRQRRAAEKRARREERKETGPDDEAVEGPSADELLEEFRVLSERHAAGAVPDDEFEARREEIYEALGMA
jgi:hypothetical protein